MQDLRYNSSTLKRYWPVTWWRHFVAKNSAMNKQALLNFCVSFIWSMHIIFTHKMSVCCTYLHNKCGVWVWNLLKPNSNTCIFDGYNHMEQVDCLMNIVRGRTWWSNSNVSDKLVKKNPLPRSLKENCVQNDYKRAYIKVNCESKSNA